MVTQMNKYVKNKVKKKCPNFISEGLYLFESERYIKQYFVKFLKSSFILFSEIWARERFFEQLSFQNRGRIHRVTNTKGYIRGLRRTNIDCEHNCHPHNCITCRICWNFMKEVSCNIWTKGHNWNKDKQQGDHYWLSIWTKYEPPIKHEFLHRSQRRYLVK